MTRTQKFYVGMTVLLAALVLVMWGFSKECLQKHHYYLLHAMIPLAAGFIAWSFHGALDLKVSGASWEGFAIGAVGGFGVFVIMLYVLQPGGTSDCNAKPDVRANEKARLRELRATVANLVAEYNNRRSNPKLLIDIRQQGRQRAEELVSLDLNSLNSAERTSVHLNAAYSYMVSAMAEDLMSPGDEKFVMECAEATVRQASAGLRAVEAIRGSPRSSENTAALNQTVQWLRDDSVEDRLNFALAAGYALQEKYRGKGADQSLRALSALDRVFRVNANIPEEPIFKVMCSRFVTSEWVAVCTKT